MKTLFKITIVASCIFIASCARQQTAKDILKDDRLREDVMMAICADSDMTKEMIGHMSMTGASQKLFPQSCQMLDKLMVSDMMKKDTSAANIVMEGMLDLLAKDSSLCDKTCSKMSQIPSIERIMERKKK